MGLNTVVMKEDASRSLLAAGPNVSAS